MVSGNGQTFKDKSKLPIFWLSVDVEIIIDTINICLIIVTSTPSPHRFPARDGYNKHTFPEGVKPAFH